jgi:hypothetical protein
MIYRQKVLDIYPDAFLGKSFSGFVVFNDINPLSQDMCFESLAWENAWKIIELEMLRKLES